MMEKTESVDFLLGNNINPIGVAIPTRRCYAKSPRFRKACVSRQTSFPASIA